MKYNIVLMDGATLQCNDYNVANDGIRFSIAEKMYEISEDGTQVIHPQGFVRIESLRYIGIAQ